MKAFKRNENKIWTGEEIGELKRLSQEGKSVIEIAEILGRSKEAVRTARCRYMPSSNIWTEERLYELRKMAWDCIPIKTIAEHFGTSHTSICRRLEAIGMKHWHREHCLCNRDKKPENEELIKRDDFEYRVFGSVSRAIDVANECRGYILSYTLGCHGIGSNVGARAQFYVRTTKDKSTMYALQRGDFGKNVLAAEIDGDVMVKRDELIRLFERCENWKGETFADINKIKEVEDEYYS